MSHLSHKTLPFSPMAGIRILNLKQTQQISPENGEDISKRMQKLMLQIKGQFMSEGGKATTMA